MADTIWDRAVDAAIVMGIFAGQAALALAGFHGLLT